MTQVAATVSGSGVLHTLRRSHLVVSALALIVLCGSTIAQDLKPRPVAIKPERAVVTSDEYQDRITVKFKDGQRVRLRQGMLTDEGTGALAGAAERTALQATAQGSWRRAYQLDEHRLDQMRATAEQSLGRQVADLNLQFDLMLPPGMTAAQAIDMFNALESVELAQAMPRPAPLPLPPNFQASQVYLNASPPGVDALGAWNASGVTGAGVRIADVEYSWNFSHQDLPPVTFLGAAAVDPFNDTNHGTAVLGEVGARNNNWGTTGISYSSSLYAAAANTVNGFSVGNAILTAAGALSAGDVIIIEQQMSGPAGGSNYVPVEWFAPTYNAIVTTVGNGIVVVEAAGNGNQNLDGPSFSTGNGGHWPFLPQNDSGAIIVGAGAAPPPLGSTTDRSRLTFSTYGTTVDLQGWGERVWTLGYGNGYSAEGVNLWYTSSFSGTSSASPIVAGACALVQSKHKAEFGIPLTPLALRDLLRSTGSPQQAGINPISQNIGPRPNVTAAIAGFIPPPPVNDSCSTASIVSMGSSSFSTVSASTDGPIEPGCGGMQIESDVWFKLGTSCIGDITVGVCDADFDAQLAVYTACPAGSGLALACSDNACGNGPQVTFFNGATGIYRFRVGGVGGTTGSGTLVISCAPAPLCPEDATGDGSVNVNDLLYVISKWGTADAAADIDNDGDVDIQDLLLVIAAWGACP